MKQLDLKTHCLQIVEVIGLTNFNIPLLILSSKSLGERIKSLGERVIINLDQAIVVTVVQGDIVTI